MFDVVPPNANDEVLEANLMSSTGSVIYIYTHIHKPYIRYIQGKVVMNIGSVGLPFDGLTMTSYAMVDIEKGNFRTTIERVNFDVEKVIQKFHEVQYPNKKMMKDVI